LQSQGIRVADVSCVSLKNWPGLILALGEALGCQARAGEMARWGEGLFLAWQNWSDGLHGDRPSVARVLAALPDGRAVVAGGDTVQGRLLALAGLKNVFADVEGYGVVSVDVGVERDLDYLLLCDTPQATSLLDDGSLEGVWQDLRVVREKRFIFVPCNLICRYSHRMKECLEALAVHFRDDFPCFSDWDKFEEVKL
jgi:ABC-type Fe3+-hydroxamate transport system substrate-binding protein